MTGDSRRSATWNGEGGLRALVGMILRDRLDQVMVAAPDAGTIRLLARSGFPVIPSGAGNVIVESLLHESALEPAEYEFQATASEVAAYGRQSGDLNPLHFDAAFAKAQGFEGTIVHGMIFNGWVTRFLGMEWPGPGTIFKRSETLFLAPVYPDQRYRVRMSVPAAERARGQYRVVAQLLDGQDRHCTISYSDVVHRNAPDRLPTTDRGD